jgi:hypothetical protein
MARLNPPKDGEVNWPKDVPTGANDVHLLMNRRYYIKFWGKVKRYSVARGSSLVARSYKKPVMPPIGHERSCYQRPPVFVKDYAEAGDEEHRYYAVHGAK